eukprot:1159924-Pelagomonas_calceolata.AAC.7
MAAGLDPCHHSAWQQRLVPRHKGATEGSFVLLVCAGSHMPTGPSSSNWDYSRGSSISWRL